MFTGHEVIQEFIDQGFELLGSGCYAAVFASKTDPNIVYKVGVNVEDPFLGYIGLNLAGLNEHFPKIHRLCIMDDYYIAVMEALTPLPVHKYTISESIRKEVKYPAGEVTAAMAELICEIKKLAESNGHKIDLHNGNIMLRNLTPVITDPLCDTEISSEWSLEGWLTSRSYESAL